MGRDKRCLCTRNACFTRFPASRPRLPPLKYNRESITGSSLEVGETTRVFREPKLKRDYRSALDSRPVNNSTQPATWKTNGRETYGFARTAGQEGRDGDGNRLAEGAEPRNRPSGSRRRDSKLIRGKTTR